MDWINALQDFPLSEVQAACRAHVEENPKAMPNEGHIKALILKARAASVAAYKASLPPPVLHDVSRRDTPEMARRAEIAASLGLRVFKRMEGTNQ